MRSTLLIPFVLQFCRTEQGKSDLVYLLSRLPREEGVLFLEECRKFAPDEDDFAFTIALASSYLRGLTPTGEPESSISRGVHAPDGSARTWIGDLGMERRIHDALLHANEEFTRLYEANPSTHEERLTGFFLARLQQNMTALEEDLHCWAKQRFGGYSSLSCQLEDVAASGPEKVWGADIGFHLVLRIRDTLQAERGILVQAKKAALKEEASPDGYRELAWPIDRAQRDILIGKSAYSLYFLYGLHSTGVGVQTIPASAVRDIMEGTQMKSRLSARVALSSSRSFPDLFLYDFIGNWWGDEETSVLEVVRGLDDAFGVRRLFRVVVSLGSVG
jgi:hypothetical protein